MHVKQVRNFLYSICSYMKQYPDPHVIKSELYIYQQRPPHLRVLRLTLNYLFSHLYLYHTSYVIIDFHCYHHPFFFHHNIILNSSFPLPVSWIFDTCISICWNSYSITYSLFISKSTVLIFINVNLVLRCFFSVWLFIFFLFVSCLTGVGLLQHYVQNGKTRDDIIQAASKLCLSFKIETPRVCFGIIHLMAVSYFITTFK